MRRDNPEIRRSEWRRRHRICTQQIKVGAFSKAIVKRINQSLFFCFGIVNRKKVFVQHAKEAFASA
jgi:hypothetical protein